MRRTATRTAIAAMAALAVLAATTPAGAVLAPFPPGDDQVRYFWGLSGPVCGPTGITASSQSNTWENVPASGADIYVRYVQDGRMYLEDGPFPPAGTGTGSQGYAGFAFPTAGYPQSAGIIARIDVDGEPTYLGGAIIFCSGPGATPVVNEYEDFFPPCGVGDRPVFPDVPASSPFCQDVEWALWAGLTTGYPDGGYHPGDPVTRQAMAAFLFRYEDPETWVQCVSVGPFSDVSASHPFCDEIVWVVLEDIATGYGDGTFRPAAPVSRQAAAAFLYRLAGEPRGADPACAVAAFDDVPTSHQFCGEIDWLRDVGITGGYDDGGFHPAAPVSRQAVAAFLHRFDRLT